MPEGFEPIASFWSIEEARLAKFRLEEDGIDVFMDGEKMVATNWIDANAVGGVKLLVHGSNVERALEILDSIGHAKVVDEPSNRYSGDSDRANEFNEGFDDEDEDDADSDHASSGALSRFRGLKTVMICLFLIPMIFGIVMGIAMIGLYQFQRF